MLKGNLGYILSSEIQDVMSSCRWKNMCSEGRISSNFRLFGHHREKSVVYFPESLLGQDQPLVWKLEQCPRACACVCVCICFRQGSYLILNLGSTWELPGSLNKSRTQSTWVPGVGSRHQNSQADSNSRIKNTEVEMTPCSFYCDGYTLSLTWAGCYSYCATSQTLQTFILVWGGCSFCFTKGEFYQSHSKNHCDR